MTWYQKLWELIIAILAVPTPLVPPPEPPKYLWDTPSRAKHSLRVICDEMGMTLEQKNTMCATVMVESGFRINAVNYNKDTKGKVLSTDWGICQWNDYYHGHEISPDEALTNPERAVRLMGEYWLRGQRTLWVAYSSGAYKKYL